MENFSRKGEYGRPAVDGALQVIDPETAPNVVLIFESYAAGMSQRQVAKMLNERHIPTSQGPRSKRECSWSKHAIQYILTNHRYIGKTTWGATSQARNPETGSFDRFDNPSDELDKMDRPDLRIISDELWAKVQERIKTATRVGVQRMGGMNRTEKSRRYIFTRFLRCASAVAE